MADSPSLDGQLSQSAAQPEPTAADSADHGDSEATEQASDPGAVTDVTEQIAAEPDAATPDAATSNASPADTATADTPAVVEVTDHSRADATAPTEEVARIAEVAVADATAPTEEVARTAEVAVADATAPTEEVARTAEATATDTTARIDDVEQVVDATRVDEVTPVGAESESERTTVAKPGSGGRTVAITPTELRTISLPSGADIARWSGRSSLPPPAPTQSEAAASTPAASQLRAPTPTPQEPADDGAPRRQPQVLPWLAALAAVVLVAVLVFGIWLIYRALDNDQARPSRTASASPVASSAAPSSSSRQSSPQPTSETTSYVETPALVLVPPVQGTTEEAASGLLRELGFQVAIRRKDSTAEPGTVLGVDPVPGTSLPAGSVVTLTVAKAPASPSPRPSVTSQRTFSSSSSWWSSSWSMG